MVLPCTPPKDIPVYVQHCICKIVTVVKIKLKEVNNEIIRGYLKTYSKMNKYIVSNSYNIIIYNREMSEL